MTTTTPLRLTREQVATLHGVNPDEVRRKLHPNRVRTGGKLTAFLGYLFQVRWTRPSISHLTITSDGMMLEGAMANEYLGDVGDLERNIRGIGEVAGLTEAETQYVIDLIPATANDWRRA